MNSLSDFNMQLWQCFCRCILSSLSNKEAHVKRAARSDNRTQASVRLVVFSECARCILGSDRFRLPYPVSQHDAPVKCLHRCHSKQELWTRSQKIGRQDEGHGWYSGHIRRATRPICCHPLPPDFAIEGKRAPWPCPLRENGMKQSSTKPSREIRVASIKRGNKANPVAIWSLQAKHDGSVLSL